MLPPTIAQLVSAAPAAGISGSRAPAPASLAALGALAAALPAAAPVCVGDAAGIDRAAARLLPRAQVFTMAQHSPAGAPFRARLAARSLACLQACAAAGGLWCAFPASPAPAGLRPAASAAACFAGYGSGTWAALALALGRGLPIVAFIPCGAAAGWALTPAGGGWFAARAAAPQLVLF